MGERILITGGAGLVGSECCRLFSERGFDVISVDNYMRGFLFGEEGNTRVVMETLLKQYDIEHHEIDILDDKTLDLIRDVNAVIHTAAQPSHPKSIEIPLIDFKINAMGTLYLLEAIRKRNGDAVFIFCSTNKVYGDAPNYYAYEKIGKRYEPVDPLLWEGFDESLRIDRSLHTPFGVSKVTGDLYTQEYARLYKLETGIFRLGCITGGAAMAVEQHNWEPYFVRKALTQEPLAIYGYEGYQVRDVIHARDLAELFYKFILDPISGGVYNIGGGRENSISLLEAIDLIEEITGNKINYYHAPRREGDHIWWISNLGKVKRDYPTWGIKTSLEQVFHEIHEKEVMRL